MIYKMTLTDSTDSMTFNLLEVPIVDKDIEGAVDNVTLDGNQYTDYLYLKKQYIQKWSLMCEDEYSRLRGFYTRQFDEGTVPTYKLYYGQNITETHTESGYTMNFVVDGVEPARMDLLSLSGDTYQQTTLPTAYKAVEYIQGSGTQYINTNIDVTGGGVFSAELDVQYTEAVDSSQIMVGTTSGTASWAGANGGYYALGASNRMTVACTTRSKAKVSFGTEASITIGNETVTMSGATIAGKVQVLGVSNGFCSSAKLYSCKIYDSTKTLVRSFVPCYRINDNIVGLYDLVSDTFFTNAGTGTFTKGAGVTPIPAPDAPQPIYNVTGLNTVTRTGKNLFDINSLASAHITVEDGEAVGTASNFNAIVGINTEGIKLPYKDLGQVAISVTAYTDGNSSTASTNGLLVRAYYTDGTVTALVFLNSQTTATTKTLITDTAKTIQKIVISYANTGGNFWHLSNFQVEKSSEVSQFDAYNENTYGVDLGKNLANFAENTELPFETVPFTIYDAGRNVSGSYVLSFILDNAVFTNSNGALVDFEEADGTHHYRIPSSYATAEGTALQVNVANTGTFYKAETGLKFRKVHVFLGSGAYSKWTSGSVSIQLELGTEPSSYSPYSMHIELNKIGNYTDRIYKTGNKWYIEEQVGKLVYNGSETWYSSGQYTNAPNYCVLQTKENDSILGAITPSLCDYFVGYSDSALYTGMPAFDEARISIGSGGTYKTRLAVPTIMLDMTSTGTQASSFVTWLTTHPTTVYYVLETPTTTEITDSTLIAQLEALQYVALPTGTNNIFTIPLGNNRQPDLLLTYTEILDTEVVITPLTPVRITLTDGGIINACGCRKDVQLTMRETTE